MKRIIDYIIEKYSPVSIITYGSYADGTNNLNSDFDALVISANHDIFHDTSFVADIQLDVFVYPRSYFSSDYDLEDFIQITDGQIVLDSDNLGASLQQKVLSYASTKQNKPDYEISASVDWCQKMLSRTNRADAEGMFRWHWVLIDSLEIFCDVVHHPYKGPKKTLRWLEIAYPEAFHLYQKALFEFTHDRLSDWIQYIVKMRRHP